MKTRYLAALLLLAGCDSQGSPDLNSAPEELRIAEKIPELLEAFEVSGLAVTVVSGDSILLADGYGVNQDGQAFSDSTPCGLYSATKVLASFTYVSLADEGLLSLDAPLSSYIEDAPTEWAEIPFYRLLNHTSGLPMVVNKEAFEVVAADASSTNKNLYQLIQDEPLDYQPGEFSHYRQSGYAIGEMIVQDKLGRSFASLIEEYVTGPTGLSSTAHSAVTDEEKPEIIISAGGFETTATDMGKLFLGLNSGSILSPQVWKNTMLEDRFRFDDYSLGGVIEERDGVLTLEHSGGGARANIRYAPDEQVGVMVCTDDQTNNWLTIHLTRMLIAEAISGEIPPMPLQLALKGSSDMTGAQVIEAYQRAKAEGSRYDLSDVEQIFNGIGYEFLSQSRADDAVQVLTFNAEKFPQSPNAHDSLAEALLASGDMSGAISRYRHVLHLDPGNEHATKMIAGILERMGEENQAGSEVQS